MGCAGSKEAKGSTTLTLPQQDTEEGRKARAEELEKKRTEYVFETEGLVQQLGGVLPWAKDPLPHNEGNIGNADALPRLAAIGAKLNAFEFEGNAKAAFEAVKNWVGHSEEAPFELFDSIYAAGFELPYVITDRKWRSDYFWGYQRLNGMMPVLVELCEELPASMVAAGLNDELVAGLLPEAEGFDTLAGLIAKRKLYKVDHSDLVGVEHHDGRPWTAPVTLFVNLGAADPRPPARPWAGTDSFFVGHDVDAPENLPLFYPIAIQLMPEAAAVVVTPKDEQEHPGMWAVSRLHAGVIDASVQIFFEHILTTHIMNESYWVATCRSLSDRHPLHAVIKPHMEVTLLMGKNFRDTTYAKTDGSLPHLHACGRDGGFEIMRRRLQTWSFQQFDMRHFFGEFRKTMDIEGYTARDDMLAHYNAIHNYTLSIAKGLYEDEAALAADTELQAFAKALHDDCKFPGVVDAITTHEQLAAVLAAPIFVGGVKHSVVDNLAYTYYGYAPNVPLSFYVEPPVSEKKSFTLKEISDGLPPSKDAVLQVALVEANFFTPSSSRASSPTTPPTTSGRARTTRSSRRRTPSGRRSSTPWRSACRPATSRVCSSSTSRSSTPTACRTPSGTNVSTTPVAKEARGA
uniref:Lipoxygenase domain-containing protein n=1 Tax=Neobodo designis TaxID=312471 RepID=A0A7S1M7L2_NEODS